MKNKKHSLEPLPFFVGFMLFAPEKNNKFFLIPFNPKNLPLTKKNHSSVHIDLPCFLKLPKLVKRSKFLVFFRSFGLLY
ncbi:MAG: hypothetical protein IAF38_07010 [Bacteroidia bacterium]|nr:hypothetical protein [Bacteroidia bacterium]